jgi:hypothetical protein
MQDLLMLLLKINVMESFLVYEYIHILLVIVMGLNFLGIFWLGNVVIPMDHKVLEQVCDW